MSSKKTVPDYIFEASWEVCNMVGGIYTVLSTRTPILKKSYNDKLIFIGPDVFKTNPNPYFTESDVLEKDWIEYTKLQFGLSIKVGRWNIPGTPIAILVDFDPLYDKKNEIYTQVWEQFGVNSLSAYGDYDESSLFGYASGMIIDSYYRFFKLSSKQKVIAHFNEWMTAFGVFYVKEYLPNIATVFTTHATSIGRSIAGNNKPLYNFLDKYNGDQMAYELNMESKHSAEKTAAHLVDCFTTVSDITAKECTYLLDKTPDIVTPNGFEDDFVPQAKDFPKKRKEARKCLNKVAETLLGYDLDKDAVFIGTAGRYEYKNKGIDVFLEALRFCADKNPKKEIVAFIMVPAHVAGKRVDLDKALKAGTKLETSNKFTTHELYHYDTDNIIQALEWYHLKNELENRVKVIFIPSYLNGFDGIFNKTYYDLLIGLDLTIFPSYYEPWGYTPLESIAFSIPTVTTDLSGFGQWVSAVPQCVETGVGIIHRSDYNTDEVAHQLSEMILKFVSYSQPQIKNTRAAALKIAKKALWENFICYYEEAYSIAINKNKKNNNKNKKTN